MSEDGGFKSLKVAKLLHLVKNYKASVETNLEHEE